MYSNQSHESADCVHLLFTCAGRLVATDAALQHLFYLQCYYNLYCYKLGLVRVPLPE